MTDTSFVRLQVGRQDCADAMMASSEVSIVHDPLATYPGPEDDYSPSEAYPEYQHGVVAAQENRTYRAVRECLRSSGLDARRHGTPAWNPLADLIPEGARVFVLSNFVEHTTSRQTRGQFEAKCTHASVLRAVIDYVLLAVGRRGEVRFGNAPLQYARWEALLEETGAGRLCSFYRRHGYDVQAVDLRGFVGERDLLGRHTRIVEREGRSRALSLGTESLLSALPPQSSQQYRVIEYNPDRTTACHRGDHVYLINKTILESDVIVSVPKLKVHQKVGITCCIKGCVGTIASKDCLAHHRSGPPSRGGDEYPSDPTGLLRQLSAFHDCAWRSDPRTVHGQFLRVLDRSARRLLLWGGAIIDGAWHGNDTAWRMAIDIARLVAHARPDGTLDDSVVRPHLAFVDGIVGGEGNGPLRPDPVSSGLVVFGRDVALVDYACCALMGYDPGRFRIVSSAFDAMRYPITTVRTPSEVLVAFNGVHIGMDEVGRRTSRRFRPPPGWVGWIGNEA